jgi:hypothetical protein
LSTIKVCARTAARLVHLDGELARSPDFVSLDARALADLAEHRTWFEMKVLRQYRRSRRGFAPLRDINYVIAINTRLLKTGARIPPLHHSMAFFNSYLRAAINGKDVRRRTTFQPVPLVGSRSPGAAATRSRSRYSSTTDSSRTRPTCRYPGDGRHTCAW